MIIVQPPQTSSRRSRRLRTAAILAGLIVTVIAIRPRELLSSWAKDLGWGGIGWNGETEFSLGHVTRGMGNWLGAQWSAPAPPTLTFDIKFRHVLTLRRRRDEALARGRLVREADDYVPAVVDCSGERAKISLRLKGDLTDHLETRKWSFRVKVKGDGQVLGMRRFSIQHPRTRDYQTEAVFLDSFRSRGILAPRFRLARVVVNGDDLGLMVVEEHFAKELLESQRRREGVILHWDESYVWDSLHDWHFGFGGIFDDFRNAPIGVFEEKRVARDPALSRQARAGAGLLRGFSDGVLTASSVFRLDKTAEYLALCTLWGASHASRWHNVRFYHDPIASKLEPIAYDAELGQFSDVTSVESEPWIAAALQDPELRRRYLAKLAELRTEAQRAAIVASADRLQAPMLDVLHAEFPLLRRFDVSRLLTRTEQPRSEERRPKADPARVIDPDHFATLAHCQVVESEGARYLEIVNAVPLPVAVRRVVETTPPDGPSAVVSLPHDLRPLPPRQAGELPRSIRIAVPAVAGDRVYHASLEELSTGQQRTVLAIEQWPALVRNPLPVRTVEQVTADHPFVRFGAESNELLVGPGTWCVDLPLVVPEGLALRIAAGTVLQFAPAAYLLARGPVHLDGEPQRRVVLEPSEAAGWGGVFVHGAGRVSRWSHVEIRETRGVREPLWHADVGVLFYESELAATDCRFEGTTAEDALNVVASRFELRRVTIDRTVSDAFDGDFAEGSIHDCRFENIGSAGGGDAIDVSGSDVTIDGVHCADVTDKALSVGEASRVRVARLKAERVGAALVAKDGSELTATACEVRAAGVAAIMAYNKKAVYGPASVRAESITTHDTVRIAVAQEGNAIRLDGVEVEPVPIDVDDLYQTAMRKPGRAR